MLKSLSVSQLKTYLLCPLKFKFTYVDKLPKPQPSPITLGRSIHTTLELNYRQKKDTKVDLSLPTITDAFSDAWEVELKQSDTLFEPSEKPGKLKDEGVKLIEVYHQTISPTIQPQSVEKPFELSFENVPYTFRGYIDLIDEAGIIVDHKILKRAYSLEQVVQDLQLTAYSLAQKLIEHKEPNELRFDMLIRAKVPKIIQLSTKRGQRDYDRFLKLLGYVSKAIESGLFYPIANYTCPKCPFRQQCSLW